MLRELCVPMPHFHEEEIAEIILKIGQDEMKYHFRVESFPWDCEDDLSTGHDELSKSLARITRLKLAIENYDPEWELIQIFTPVENSKYIQVLYRKRKT
ncbi:MAG: hypothetical protein ACP5D1_11990 [Bacteroidales bacterium]